MGSLISSIKNEAKKSGTVIQSSECDKLMVLFNKMFYAKKDKEKESAFVNQVITRGLEGEERIGLHASEMITSEKDYCLRKHVLSLHFKRSQGQELPVNIKRIFEEGNAVHEKWQRLFIRAGYSKVEELDKTQFIDEWKLSFTPDIICKIPNFFDGKMVGEVKSVNPFQFEKMNKHPSAWKQVQWYMRLLIKKAKAKGKWNGKDYTKGFVLCDNKGNQDFRVEIYDIDKEISKPFVLRTEEIIEADNRFITKKKMVQRPSLCTDPECDICSKCALRDACWNIGKGREGL